MSPGTERAGAASAPGSGSDAPVLFLSNYFPPEVNALAIRTWEQARLWAEAGGRIEVLTGPPHFPEGVVYDGYRNAVSRERTGGVDVLRVPMYVAENRGLIRRTLSYVSYMVAAAWFARMARRRPGVVVASSPQFFAGLAGWIVSRRYGLPFVLEIRDLWPESIVQVGAMRRGRVIRILERLETLLYRAADHIVVVSPAFRAHIEERGISSERISVLPNGVDPEWSEPAEAGAAARLRTELGLEGRFVASYIGTVGLAHGLETVLEAARRCSDPDVVFLVVGTGARREALRTAAEGQTNFLLLEKQPREHIGLFYRISDVSIVHLLDRPAFRKVIPSKMLEAMAMRRPVVLGVEGQAREILEAAGAGIPVTPEDPEGLLRAVLRLKADPALAEHLGAAGADHVAVHFDRRRIARAYWDLLQRVAAAGTRVQAR